MNSVLCFILPALALFAGSAVTSALGQVRFVTVAPDAANETVFDADGDTPAYLEIRTTEPLTLSGYYLTDSTANPRRWQVPDRYVLTQGQTIRIFASGKDRRPLGPEGELHTDFAFECILPNVYLYDPKGQLVDSARDPKDYCACDGLKLVRAGSVARYRVPVQETGTAWTQVGFNDTSWKRGLVGIGYDSGVSPFNTNLVLYHTLDRADVSRGTVLDRSGPVLHTGSIKGAPGLVNARILEGFSYPSNSADHVLVAHHNELNPGAGSFSVSLWFNAARGAAGRTDTYTECLVSKGGTVATVSGWSILRNSGSAGVRVVSTQGVAYDLQLGLTISNTWHHLAFVINRSANANVIQGYLNGVLVDTEALPALTAASFANDLPLYEGRDPDGRIPFKGVLDDFAIWGRALTAAQVAQLYALGTEGLSFLDGSAFPGAGPYAGLIQTDIRDALYGVNPGFQVRVPFLIGGNPAAASQLRLLVNFDDGFVCYLNGAQVAVRNAPDAPAWNAGAASDRPDELALQAHLIDLAAYSTLLRSGLNVLAFHVLNRSADDPRCVLLPELCLQPARPTGQEPCVKITDGTDFWVTFPENFEEEPDAPLELSLCIAGSPGNGGVVEIPGLSWSAPYVIAANGSAKVVLPKTAELDGPNDREHKAVHVTAKAPVAVYGISHKDYTTDSFLALPTHCLGTEYLVMSYPNVHDNVPLLQGTQFAVAAPYDFTTVTITPREQVGAYLAGVPFKVVLHRGETFQLRNEAGKPADLTGTEIRSDKPVAVFGSHRCANVASDVAFFCDVLLEHLLPVSLWGRSYHLAPLLNRKADTVRVLASRDKTPVQVDGVTKAILNRGEHYDFQIQHPGPGIRPLRISAELPVLVAHFSHSANFDNVLDADPFMAQLQPESSWRAAYLLCIAPHAVFNLNYLNVIVPGQNLSEVRLDGVALSTLPGATVSLPASSGLVAIRAPVPAGGPGRRLTSRVPVGLTSYGFAKYDNGAHGFDSYAHPGGMQFGDAEGPVLICPPQLTVRCEKPGSTCVASTPDLRQYVEMYDDCSPRDRLGVVQSPQPGTPLGLGTHVITLTAHDGNGNSSTCTVTVVVEPQWQEGHFGAAVANPQLEATVWGFAADPDKDGLQNLTEYMGGSDPNDPQDRSALPQLELQQQDGQTFLKISFREPNGTAALVPVPEGSRDLDDWRSGGDVFEPLIVETVVDTNGAYRWVSFLARETVGAAPPPYYFIRLRYEAR